MGKFKWFAVGAGATLIALGGVGALWYRSNYVVPPELERTVALPSPNGFDTLQQAFRLEIGGLDGVTTSPPKDEPPGPLEKRLKLLTANQPSIEKTREALSQEYLTPPIKTPGEGFLRGAPTREQARMLTFAARTHAESGNLAEGMRCALDAIELGVTIPRGGPVIPALVGYACESIGEKSAWEIADKLDPKAARAAVERLEKIEARRWPLVKNFEEDRHLNNRTWIRSLFQGNLKEIWEATGSDMYFSDGTMRNAEGEVLEQPSLVERAGTLWTRMRIVYHGPKTVMENSATYQKAIEERAKLPWGSQRPTLPVPSDPLTQLMAPLYPQAEFKEASLRTRAALLRAHLALRAAFLETGRYPDAPNLPTDPFSPTRSPLRYKTDGKKFTLWSVGPDAKDDGGEPIEGQQWQRADDESYKPGDVVARENTR
jgi:hypothetical protein